MKKIEVLKELIAGVKEHKHKSSRQTTQEKIRLNAKLCNTEDYGSKACWVEHRLQNETESV